ncbi:PilN domain-containing protein [Legionella jamestowniensis]|uniref:Tfp pilus assembly protein PilN n=1 Tax=Legionella jamestowniensis TaxID=455 RepID=A0A0W0UH25_9GAMM|nr:PilN domain-containing protein [Legionella jamestowniensis]KTD07151.1 Tfp pilus assembly protein PilN [Legionella jamestowniensis]OCH98898.1 hypothetical protein A8135_09045 [Legionella jamestowniensis]SFL71636.1 type IV pilus assembly protein PilN [Legionella jamestowniensis DSM 19215]
MTEINLLPWRRLRKIEGKRKFKLVITLGFFVALSFIVIVNFLVKNILTNQINRSYLLKNEINLLNEKIREISKIKSDIRSIKESIINLLKMQNNPVIVIRFFDCLSKETPDNIRLILVELKNNKMIIKGQSKNHVDIGKMMRNITRNRWVSNAKLVEIVKRHDQEESNRFKMQADMEIQNGLE